MSKDNIERFANVGLRLASLVAKLGFSVYLGRYVTLEDIAIYGLIFGVVMTANAIMGIRIDFAVSRELVGMSPNESIHKMRDQAIFYGLNYVIVVILGFIVVLQGAISGKIVFYVVALTVAESFGNMTSTNMNSMNMQLLSNVLFFVRSGLWAIVVAFVGMFDDKFRTIDFILAAWLLGVLVSIGVTFWIWRELPWRTVIRMPIDWGWIGQSIKKCIFLWLGAIGLVIGSYVDRFVIQFYLGLEKVGVATFYLSFTSSLITLVQSGVLSLSYPKLITFYRQNNEAGFWDECRQMAWHVAMFSAAASIGIGITLPLLGAFFHRPEFVEDADTLWLMLAGTWMRANAETLYNILFARNQDRAIWLGNLWFLLPSFGGNLILLPIMGLPGAGWSAIIAGAFLFLWRWVYVKSYISPLPMLAMNKTEPTNPSEPRYSTLDK